MKIRLLLFITLILGFFQITCLDYFRIFGVKPDLFLVVVVIAGLSLELRQAVIFGLCAGLCKYIFSVNTFGVDILLFSLWGFVVAKLSRKISIDDNITRVLLLFIIALLQNIISGLLAYSGNFFPLGIFLRITIVGSLYTAISLPLILKFTKARI